MPHENEVRHTRVEILSVIIKEIFAKHQTEAGGLEPDGFEIINDIFHSLAATRRQGICLI